MCIRMGVCTSGHHWLFMGMIFFFFLCTYTDATSSFIYLFFFKKKGPKAFI